MTLFRYISRWWPCPFLDWRYTFTFRKGVFLRVILSILALVMANTYGVPIVTNALEAHRKFALKIIFHEKKVKAAYRGTFNFLTNYIRQEGESKLQRPGTPLKLLICMSYLFSEHAMPKNNRPFETLRTLRRIHSMITTVRRIYARENFI